MRTRLPSLSAMPTDVIVLSPAFIAALEAIAPKRRRRMVPMLLAAVGLASAVWLGGPSVSAAATAYRLSHRPFAAAPAPVPPTASLSTTDPRVALAPIVAPQVVPGPGATATAVAMTVPVGRATKATKAPRKPSRKGSR